MTRYEVGPVARFARRFGFVRLSEITMTDIASVFYQYDIRAQWSFRPAWQGPWRLDRRTGVWRRPYGNGAETFWQELSIR